MLPCGYMEAVTKAIETNSANDFAGQTPMATYLRLASATSNIIIGDDADSDCQLMILVTTMGESKARKQADKPKANLKRNYRWDGNTSEKIIKS